MSGRKVSPVKGARSKSPLITRLRSPKRKKARAFLPEAEPQLLPSAYEREFHRQCREQFTDKIKKGSKTLIGSPLNKVKTERTRVIKKGESARHIFKR